MYKCNFCDKTFTRKYSLIYHLEKNKIYRESIHVSDIKFDHDHIILPDRLAFENKSLVLYNYI